jgi:two-component system, NarL family, sensor kinase
MSMKCSLKVPGSGLGWNQAEATAAYLQALLEHSPVATILLNPEHRPVACNPAFERLFRYSLTEIKGRDINELIAFPEQREEAAKLTRTLLDGKKVRRTTRRRRKDGAAVEVEVYGIPLMQGGELKGIYGLYQDVTQRKQAESKLRQLSGKLMELQELEQRRVARELHDTTSQELALLSLYLGRLERMLEPESSASALVSEIKSIANQCSQKIRSVSYVLHPPLLQEAGLRPAVSWLAEGFEQRSGIQVHLQISPNFGRLAEPVELALFRVLQESLSNILRHTATPSVDIRLRRTESGVQLQVMDAGTGAKPMKRPYRESAYGLGLPGMQERLHQLGGSLDVDFSSSGTTVRASVPLL